MLMFVFICNSSKNIYHIYIFKRDFQQIHHFTLILCCFLSLNVIGIRSTIDTKWHNFIVRTHITDRFIEFFELYATCHNDILSLETFHSIITVVKINLYCIVTKMTLSLSLEVEYDECKLFIDQL